MEAVVKHPDIKKILTDRGLDGSGRDIWTKRLGEIKASEVEWALLRRPGYYVLDRLLILVSPAAENYLEQMAQIAHQITLQRFGRIIWLYEPLYLSNFCVNDCVYCGFNKNHKFSRVRLTIEQALADAEIIAAEGFRDLLLVSGEDKEFITADYLITLADKLREKFSSISVEIYPMEKDEYEKLFKAGIEGVTIYQETYYRNVYTRYHPQGPKADYDWRLNTLDRAASAGMREIGIGALLGLSDWRLETLALGEHAQYLMKRYWKSHVSFSFPRLRPAKDVDEKKFPLISDKELVQMILALRLCFADAGMVLSTRERAELRDKLIGLGITRMSAGSKTSPGGYSDKSGAVGQFEVDDNRTPSQIAEMIKSKGLEPVWKDWDKGFTNL